MQGFSEKLLAILLSLALALAPWHAVIAGFYASANHDGKMHQTVEGHDAHTTLATDSADHDCERRGFCDDCSSQDCLSGQCVFATLLSTFPRSASLAATAGFPSAQFGFVSPIPSFLYRPPRG